MTVQMLKLISSVSRECESHPYQFLSSQFPSSLIDVPCFLCVSLLLPLHHICSLFTDGTSFPVVSSHQIVEKIVCFVQTRFVASIRVLRSRSMCSRNVGSRPVTGVATVMSSAILAGCADLSMSSVSSLETSSNLPHIVERRHGFGRSQCTLTRCTLVFHDNCLQASKPF